MKLFIIILFFLLRNTSHAGDPPLDLRDFSCTGLRGFYFTYPIFKTWEPPSSQNFKAVNSQCVIPLGTGVSQLKVSQAFYHGIPGEMEAPASLSLKTPKGVYYRMEKDSLTFWAGDSTVEIQLVGIPDHSGFIKEQFWQVVVKSLSSNLIRKGR